MGSRKDGVIRGADVDRQCCAMLQVCFKTIDGRSRGPKCRREARTKSNEWRMNEEEEEQRELM